MALSSTEIAWIVSHPEAVAHARTYALSPQSLVADLSALRSDYGEYARGLTELVQASQKNASKLPKGMLMTAESAQQATPFPVALFRARHIKDTAGDVSCADVTCSIGTELLALRRAGLRTWAGADIDLDRVRIAHYNLTEVDLDGAGSTEHNPLEHRVVQANALEPAFSTKVIIADPARRSDGRRITTPDKLIPPVPDLIEAYKTKTASGADSPEMAIKCAPGLDYTDWEGHVDVVSLNGGVKEVCLYTPGLRPHSFVRSTDTRAEEDQRQTRRAVVLKSNSATDYEVADTISSLDPATGQSEVMPAGDYILEPDGAIIRAGLVQQFAQRHGLWQLDPHIAFLSGDDVPADMRGFEIIERSQMKTLKKDLRSLDCGSVEILVRGSDIDPADVRKRLKLKGSHALSVIIVRVGTGSASEMQVYICSAVDKRQGNPT